MRRLLLPLLFASFAACTLSLPGRTPDRPAALQPGAVQVTVLDAQPAPASTPTAPAAKPAPQPPAETAGFRPESGPKSDPETRPETRSGSGPEPAPPSAEQRACTAKGGIWSATGASPLRTCLTPTRDAGKSCRKESDCDGLCLARSRTCAPVKPLFGCNDILQADGTRATLCMD